MKGCGFATEALGILGGGKGTTKGLSSGLGARASLGVGGLSKTGHGLSKAELGSLSSNPESTLDTGSGVMTIRSRGSRSGSGVLTFLSLISRSFLLAGFRLFADEPGLNVTSVSSPFSSHLFSLVGK